MSGRLCERKDDGTVWSWIPWLLRRGMTERGTTGAGRPRITGVPRVHRILELDGCGTMRGNIRFGYHGICPLTSLATIHGSPVTNGAKLSHCGMKSRLRGRPACWTPAKARAKNRLAPGAGDSRRDQMSHSQQLRMRRLRSTGHRKKDRLTAVPRAGVLQQEVPSHQKQSEAHGEAGEENEASDDEWKIKLIKHTQKLPSARCRQLGHKKRQSFLPGPSEEGQLRGWCQQVSMGRSARSEVY